MAFFSGVGSGIEKWWKVIGGILFCWACVDIWLRVEEMRRKNLAVKKE